MNKLMSDLLGRLEDADCYRAADRMMTILLDCSPREGAHRDKALMISEKIRNIRKVMQLC